LSVVHFQLKVILFKLLNCFRPDVLVAHGVLLNYDVVFLMEAYVVLLDEIDLLVFNNLKLAAHEAGSGYLAFKLLVHL